ncbi:MAG: hypothetical protein C0390_03005 [Syntrophus sp. (in: bacteria)]|nr:hypothetical protein [Syntrophus sp. (in: bacteria)]
MVLHVLSFSPSHFRPRGTGNDGECQSESYPAPFRETVESVIQDMKHTGEEIPQPIAGKRYSGKFMVRVPPEVHRNLAIQASESGVSLNRIVGAKLSR